MTYIRRPAKKKHTAYGPPISLFKKYDAIAVYGSKCCLEEVKKEVCHVYDIFTSPIIISFNDLGIEELKDNVTTLRSPSVLSFFSKLKSLYDEKKWKNVIVIANDIDMEACLEAARICGINAKPRNKVFSDAFTSNIVRCKHNNLKSIIGRVRIKLREVRKIIFPFMVLSQIVIMLSKGFYKSIIQPRPQN